MPVPEKKYLNRMGILLVLLEGTGQIFCHLAGTGEEGELRPLDPLDRSVRIHSCHSPLREIEVLYDNILAMLDISYA